MESAVRGIPGVAVNIDDVIITGQTEKEHDVPVKQVLKVLPDLGLRIKAEKSEFKRKEVKLIGFQISASGVKPTVEKITAITEAPEPTNRKQLEAY